MALLGEPDLLNLYRFVLNPENEVTGNHPARYIVGAHEVNETRNRDLFNQQHRDHACDRL